MDIVRNKIVGEVLTAVRREHLLTQEDVAALTGYSQSTISKTEAGQRQLPFIESYLFCAAMGEAPMDFINRVYIRLGEENLLPVEKPEDEE
jgi:transcriptional regulator with XRE-family HTH domain